MWTVTVTFNTLLNLKSVKNFSGNSSHDRQTVSWSVGFSQPSVLKESINIEKNELKAKASEQCQFCWPYHFMNIKSILFQPLIEKIQKITWNVRLKYDNVSGDIWETFTSLGWQITWWEWWSPVWGSSPPSPSPSGRWRPRPRWPASGTGCSPRVMTYQRHIIRWSHRAVKFSPPWCPPLPLTLCYQARPSPQL